MTRFLLALLAVLTGFAAAGQSVSAQSCAEKPSAMAPVGCAQASAAEATAAATRRAMPEPSHDPAARHAMAQAYDAPSVSAVLLGSDRARE